MRANMLPLAETKPEIVTNHYRFRPSAYYSYHNTDPCSGVKAPGLWDTPCVPRAGRRPRSPGRMKGTTTRIGVTTEATLFMTESHIRVNNNNEFRTKLLRKSCALAKLVSMSANSILFDQIAAKKNEISHALRRVEVLKAELATLEKVVRLLGVAVEPEHTASRRTKSSLVQTSRGRRGLSVSSKAVLAAMADDPEKSFDYDALLRVSEEKGFPTTNSTLRSQMLNCKKRGLVEPVGYGEYRITKLGVEECRQLQVNGPEQAPLMDEQESESSQ
jgi:hypothetical protein